MYNQFKSFQVKYKKTGAISDVYSITYLKPGTFAAEVLFLVYLDGAFITLSAENFELYTET